MNDIWVFKHEPSTLDEMIMTDKKKEICQEIINTLPNTLIAGFPGTGKSTFMNVLKKTTGVDWLKINGSEETGIDTVRDKIKSFATSYSSNKKIVYINECMDENESIQIDHPDKKELLLKDMEFNKSYLIKSFNPHTQKKEIDVAEKISEKIDDIYEVSLEDGRSVRVNQDHPFFINRFETNRLKELKEGDEIFTIDYVKIKSITHVGVGKVVDISVLNNHNFFTSNGILTHNCDRISANAQNSLNQIIEDVQSITRFFLVCNNINRITAPILSRCSYKIDFNDPPAKAIYSHLIEILKKEGVKVKDKSILIEVIKKLYPDIRQIIETVRSNVINKTISNISFGFTNDIFNDIFDAMLKGEIDVVRKILKSNYIDYAELFNFIYKEIMDSDKEIKKPAEVIIKTGEYSYKNEIVAIKEINFMAYFLELLKQDVL